MDDLQLELHGDIGEADGADAVRWRCL